jgi:3-dehydroquinate dehydratase
LTLLHDDKGDDIGASKIDDHQGPNLNYPGIREPHIYGYTTLAAVETACRAFAEEMDVELSFHQSNFEGTIVELINRVARTRTPSSSIRPPILSPRLRSSTL